MQNFPQPGKESTHARACRAFGIRGNWVTRFLLCPLSWSSIGRRFWTQSGSCLRRFLGHLDPQLVPFHLHRRSTGCLWCWSWRSFPVSSSTSRTHANWLCHPYPHQTSKTRVSTTDHSPSRKAYSDALSYTASRIAPNLSGHPDQHLFSRNKTNRPA